MGGGERETKSALTVSTRHEAVSRRAADRHVAVSPVEDNGLLSKRIEVGRYHEVMPVWKERGQGGKREGG